MSIEFYMLSILIIECTLSQEMCCADVAYFSADELSLAGASAHKAHCGEAIDYSYRKKEAFTSFKTPPAVANLARLHK